MDKYNHTIFIYTFRILPFPGMISLLVIFSCRVFSLCPPRLSQCAATFECVLQLCTALLQIIASLFSLSTHSALQYVLFRNDNYCFLLVRYQLYKTFKTFKPVYVGVINIQNYFLFKIFLTWMCIFLVYRNGTEYKNPKTMGVPRGVFVSLPNDPNSLVVKLAKG